jgi:hypothetical protein
MYQLFFCKTFRHPWHFGISLVSWPWQPWRSRDWGWSLLQRSNGSGGFTGSGLNITTRVSKSTMDAYTHPNWYLNGYISEWFLNHPEINFQSVFFFTVPWMWVDSCHRKTIPSELIPTRCAKIIIKLVLLACDALFLPVTPPKWVPVSRTTGCCESVRAYQAPINRSARSGCSARKVIWM